MLNNANGFKKIYIATGYTDLRRGMEGLAAIIRFQFNLDPYDKDTLFFFCGKRTDRIKGTLQRSYTKRVQITLKILETRLFSSFSGLPFSVNFQRDFSLDTNQVESDLANHSKYWIFRQK